MASSPRNLRQSTQEDDLAAHKAKKSRGKAPDTNIRRSLHLQAETGSCRYIACQKREDGQERCPGNDKGFYILVYIYTTVHTGGAEQSQQLSRPRTSHGHRGVPGDESPDPDTSDPLESEELRLPGASGRHDQLEPAAHAAAAGWSRAARRAAAWAEAPAAAADAVATASRCVASEDDCQRHAESF
eukprot:748430-Hanusia_phi.AAC.1